LLAELRDRSFSAVEGAEHVGLHEAADQLRRNLLEVAEEIGGGVVHPDVDSPEARDRGIAQREDL